MPEVEFRCMGAEGGVSVAGSWSSWAQLPLERDGMGWSANLDLPPGKHLYKFIVEGSWIHDPTRPTETDPEGNVNNVVTVDEHGVVGEEEESEEEEEEEEEQQRCQCQRINCDDEEDSSSDEEGSEEDEEDREEGDEKGKEKEAEVINHNDKGADEQQTAIKVAPPGSGRWVKEAEPVALDDEGAVEQYTDIKVGAPGSGSWVKEALGKDEKAEARARKAEEMRKLKNFMATVARIRRLHKEVRYLQQKLGTAWFKEVAELEASITRERSAGTTMSVRQSGRVQTVAMLGESTTTCIGFKADSDQQRAPGL